MLAFLHACIDSVEQVEVLLLLHNHPEKSWTVREITAELRSTENSISKRLADLYSRKVLVADPKQPERHRYSPASEELRDVIRRLSEENAIRPYRVIDAIYSKPPKDLLAFSESFKMSRKS